LKKFQSNEILPEGLIGMVESIPADSCCFCAYSKLKKRIRKFDISGYFYFYREKTNPLSQSMSI
jgi:hypothetical protein